MGDPAVAADVERIRAILAERERRRLASDPAMTDAAVLLPLFAREDALHVLFTLRTETVGRHQGQVSFPGGGRSAEDVDAAATALRETEEELGIPPERIEVVGALDDMVTNTGFRVTPLVGVIPWPIELAPNPHEIADVFSIPLPRLLDPACSRVEERRYGDRTYFPVYHFEGGRHDVWGVTGHILAHFLEVAFGWRHPEVEARRAIIGDETGTPASRNRPTQGDR